MRNKLYNDHYCMLCVGFICDSSTIIIIDAYIIFVWMFDMTGGVTN